MLLFRGNGKRFEDVSASSGPVFSQPYASRGMAVGDFNNDGGLDVLVGINNGAPLLLKNNAGRRNHWVGIKLVAKQSNPDGIGALITCQAGDLKRSTHRSGGGSYLAAHDPRIVLGIGARPRIDWVQVKWPLPSGRVERFTDLPVDQYTNLVEGHGKKV
jgi:enediyne biosynthesis protein E4